MYVLPTLSFTKANHTNDFHQMIFVGEHTSYTHAWIASALESGVRGSVQLMLELGLVDEAKATVEKWMARWIEVVSTVPLLIQVCIHIANMIYSNPVCSAFMEAVVAVFSEAFLFSTRSLI